MSHVELNMGNIQAMFADPAGPVGQIIEKKAYEVEAMMKALLLIPGSGGIYLPGVLTFSRHGKIYSNFATGGRTTPHLASAAGEPPSSDTGSLLNTLFHTLGVEETVYANVGSPLEYATYLEHGTRFMAPRPFMVPALHLVLG